MNDTFYEQFITQKTDSKDMMSRILIFAAAFLLCIIGFWFMAALFVAPAIFIVYMTYTYILPNFKKEYEYSLSNHYLDIAVIYNKEKRKDKLSIDIQKAEIIAPAKSSRLQYFRPVKTQNFASSSDAANAFAILISINNELNCILIEPDEQMKKMMKNWMGSRMYLD